MKTEQVKQLAESVQGLSATILRETLKEIRNDEYTIDPNRIDEWQRFVNSTYATLNDEMKQLEKEYPFAWRKIRENYTSDKQADLEYNATPEGQRRIELKYDLKSLEKLSSSLKRTQDKIRADYFNSTKV